MNPAYVAGLFDGEGNIYISKDLVHLQVSITQKETPILFLLKQEFGGVVGNSGNSCYKWRVTSIGLMLNFLQTIQPYAFIKANEIKITIAFLEGMRKRNIGRHPLSSDEVERRSTLREKFYLDRKLNQPYVEETPLPNGA